MIGSGSSNTLKRGVTLGNLNTGNFDEILDESSGLESVRSKIAVRNQSRGFKEFLQKSIDKREMDRRNAIPLMVDELAIEAARKRAVLNQLRRSGRQSTMLTNNSDALGG